MEQPKLSGFQDFLQSLQPGATAGEWGRAAWAAAFLTCAVSVLCLESLTRFFCSMQPLPPPWRWGRTGLRGLLPR